MVKFSILASYCVTYLYENTFSLYVHFLCIQKLRDCCFLFFILQDKRLGKPKNHCSTARQQAGQAVRHEWGSSGSPPTEQQTGTIHRERKRKLYYCITSLLALCRSNSLALFMHQTVQFSCFLLLLSYALVLNLALLKRNILQFIKV